jgi:nucleotide-binding universal stress UspA family protein
MRPIQHILVAVDFGEPSSHALDVALDLAKTFDAKVTLVHVIPWPVADIASEAQRMLDAVLVGVKLRYPRTYAIVREGLAAHQILAVVMECGADLIVVGTHGRRGLPRFLVGSVAENVVRCSPVPVLTVPAEPS